MNNMKQCNKMLFSMILLFACALALNAQIQPGSIVEENIDEFLSTPANGFVKEIPVVVIRYLPTTDGKNIDVSKATDYGNLGNISVEDMKTRINNFDKNVKFALEEGSKFRGYKNPGTTSFLGYKVVKYLSVYRQIYTGNHKVGTDGGKDLFQPDFKKEFDELELSGFINENDIKEVWIWFGEAARPGWPSYNEDLHGGIEKHVSFVESNMASPVSGDISNSYRYNDDLYILNDTYIVYCQNFRRTQAEAIHNHGHQLESMYKYIAQNQDGNYGLFVQNFSGWGDNTYTIPPLGRAGDTHHPPNTTQDYDYQNTTLVESDIEDWKPSGGTKKQVNAQTWGSINYNWPENKSKLPQKTESQWYIYWMQNMPGFDNEIPYNSKIMTNWWDFTADWDSCQNNRIGLYKTLTSVSSPLEIEIKIFPNPVENTLNIQFNSNVQSAQIELFNVYGICILKRRIQSGFIQINTSETIPGIYFLHIKRRDGQTLKSVKIIKS